MPLDPPLTMTDLPFQNVCEIMRVFNASQSPLCNQPLPSVANCCISTATWSRPTCICRLATTGRLRSAARELLAGPPAAALDALAPTLAPLFTTEIARTFLPWANANAASASRQKHRFSVTLDNGVFEQSTQNYAARSFQKLRYKVRGAAEAEGLTGFMAEAGFAEFFAEPKSKEKTTAA